MAGLLLAAWLSAAFPLVRAWSANRRTTLIHTINWAIGAWATWGWLFAAELLAPAEVAALRYLALCMTGCAAVALLKARRPGLVAWNGVVVGLLAVDLLPLAEGMARGGPARPEWYRVAFATLVACVGVLNYLPTALAPAACMLGGGVVLQAVAVASPAQDAQGVSAVLLGEWLIVLAPWIALARLRSVEPGAFDRLWSDFKNRFGLVWAQRVREQFNNAAANTGWPVYLYWRGLRLLQPSARLGPDDEAVFLGTLQALLKRFGPEDRDEAA